MKKLGNLGNKGLKIVHISLITLFFGGIMSSLALNTQLNLSAFNDVIISYRNLTIISDSIVRVGAQGTLIIGILYGIWTNWGFFKHKWITVKWVVFIVQTLIGIFLVDKLMVANMTLLEAQQEAALNNATFIQNHILRQYVVILQVVLTVFLLCISVLKPWRRKA